MLIFVRPNEIDAKGSLLIHLLHHLLLVGEVLLQLVLHCLVLGYALKSVKSSFRRIGYQKHGSELTLAQLGKHLIIAD